MMEGRGICPEVLVPQDHFYNIMFLYLHKYLQLQKAAGATFSEIVKRYFLLRVLKISTLDHCIINHRFE